MTTCVFYRFCEVSRKMLTGDSASVFVSRSDRPTEPKRHEPRHLLLLLVCVVKVAELWDQ